MNAKTFLFDFDGTLVDSMPTFAEVMLRILDENGIKYGKDIIKIITPLGYNGTAELFIKMGVDMTADALVKKMIGYIVFEYENNIPAKDTVIESLQKMRARGDSLNVLTASPHEALDPCLKRLGIWELFDNVWSCDDFNTSKSNPQIYSMAADRLGKCVGEVIFVDDMPAGARIRYCISIFSTHTHIMTTLSLKRTETLSSPNFPQKAWTTLLNADAI